jgi:hypothetical protein
MESGSTPNPPEKELETGIKASNFPDWYLVERQEAVCHSPVGDVSTPRVLYETLTHTLTPASDAGLCVAALTGTPIVDNIADHC